MRDRPGLRNVVFDCHQPLALARWWAEALGWMVRPYDEEDLAWLAEHGLTAETDPSVGMDPPDPSLPAIFFNQVPEAKVVKNRVHVDVNVADATGIDRLVALGARVLRAHPDGEVWTIRLTTRRLPRWRTCALPCRKRPSDGAFADLAAGWQALPSFRNRMR